MRVGVSVCCMAFRSIVNGAANDDTPIHLECRRQQPFLLFSHSRSLSLSVTGHLSLSIFYKILLNTERVYAEAAAAKSGRKIATEKKECTMCLEKKTRWKHRFCSVQFCTRRERSECCDERRKEHANGRNNDRQKYREKKLFQSYYLI